MAHTTAVISSPAMATTWNFPTFLLSVVVLLYLSTFVVFAVIRILTGISIQRVGYLSLKRISFELEDGIRLEVRKLGLTLHRPTFAQPTWVSLVVQDSQITLNSRPKSADVEGSDEEKKPAKRHGLLYEKLRNKESAENIQADAEEKTTNMLDGLRRAKDNLKKMHKWIKWIRMVDIGFANANVAVPGVGNLQIGSVSMMVDTRRKTTDRKRMFDHCTDLKNGQRPVEWLLSTKSILFFPTDSKDPIEIMDHSVFTIYGVLEAGIDGIRDLAFALKVGRMSIPLDELLLCSKKFRGAREVRKRKYPKPRASRVSLSAMMEEIATSRTDRMAEAVLESKELLESFLKGIKEIQFAIGHLIVSKSMPRPQTDDKPLQFTLAMKELGMDVHRLDQKSPAHRMYFSSKDIAHQALLAAISISVSVRDGESQDLLMYVPMVTMTSRTTLLSKTLEIIEKSESNRNNNILFANMVVTSPAIDLKPEHLPIFMAMISSRDRSNAAPNSKRAHLMSRLLPKATIKFSIQEPVVRIVLPPTEPEHCGPDDIDMLISSLSSISVDLESSHEAEGQSNYMLTSTFRVTSHVLYYRAASGAHHDLLHTETFDLKTQLTATPEVQVVASAYLSAFSLRLVRPEIVNGLKQLAEQFRIHYKPRRQRPSDFTQSQNFVRSLPVWLEQFKLECNDFVVEVAGVDEKVSDNARGAAFQMDSWTFDYKCRKADPGQRITPRRRTASRNISVDESRLKPSTSTYKGPSNSKNPTDGRKLTFHARGFEGFIVESYDSWEQDPFLQIPMFDIGFSTSNDHDGPLLNIASPIKSVVLNYSLYRHYSVIVAGIVLREVFGKKQAPVTTKDDYLSPKSHRTRHGEVWGSLDMVESPITISEFISLDIKIQHVKLKADLPSDPPMMVEMHGVDAGRHRWGFPFLKAKNFRLYAESPKVQKCWARLISLRHFRVDLRDTKKRKESTTVSEKSIDLCADAIRIAVPHQLILYKVTDNIINTFKACEQMQHRFKTRTNEYILEKKPEGPKKVPKVTLRTKALLLELEDDPFETQLGMIYRVGLSEQRKRIAREDAFEAKARKLEEMLKRKSWNTDRTGDHLRTRGRSRTYKGEHPSSLRTDPAEVKPRSKSAARSMRYDPENASEPTEAATVSIDDAWAKLQEHNSEAWIKRIRLAKEVDRQKMSSAREAFWGHDDMPSDVGEGEHILGLPLRPSLMACFFNDVSITIDKPSFAMDELPEFLHRVGKGLPKDTLFSLLVPVSIKIDFSEAKVLLRDYPLPFIHVPHLRPGQPSRLSSWSLKSDFVLAEEFRPGLDSMRHAKVCIVPPTMSAGGTPIGGFGIDVRRTVSPVKSYSDIKVAINTSYATRITWCTSYQPAIQDMMMVFETFTKPHVDPSERTGFWDKIRLILHSQITLGWEGDGDVHLTLKGSRDPYTLTGDGAGFVMCWRGDVRWDMARVDDPRKFMEITSDEYLLAIPDFTNEASQEVDFAFVPEAKSFYSSNSGRNSAFFKKVIMKLSGRVSWVVGLMFEQEITDHEDWKQRERSFEFKPHYEVTLKSPEYAKAPPGEVYDAFRGFRSHHLHLSLEIISPVERSPANTKTSGSYNTIHLTPRFFTHFYAWWGLFSGAMSLPIRQGELWPGPEKSSKKFGRHLATIKYKLCLSPLFVSHIYKHHDRDDDGNDIVAATGLKARLDTFLLDIHQRREENVTNPKSTVMRINQAELDFHSADIRAVFAVVDKVTIEELVNQDSMFDDDSVNTGLDEGDISQFTITDNDYTWIDMDDFVELDWILPKNKTPRTKITPLAYTPRFTYFRQTDHSTSSNDMMSPFGNEASHDCILSQSNDPREIQCALVQARLERVNEQMSKNKQAIENLAVHTRSNPENLDLQAQSEKLILQSEILFNKLEFLEDMLRKISRKLQEDSKTGSSGYESSSRGSSDDGPELPPMDANAFGDYSSDFDNRFIVHNMQAKWNNSLRNIILKYIHQVNQRRGFVYYMSRRAVKFIVDILEEQKATGQYQKSASTEFTDSPTGPVETKGDDASIEKRIQQLLSDNVKVAVAEETQPGVQNIDESATMLARDDLAGDVADEYVPQNSYHVRLIAPQIQMQSEKNEGAAVLVAAQGMQLKIVSIMDRERVGDEVSGLVQRRFALNLDNTQFFVSHHQDFAPSSMSLHSANRYGAPGNSSWPPWVPLESMFDFRNNPVGFSRVVERTSATLRYDKHNSLRLKYSDQVSGVEAELAATKNGPIDTERRIDYVWVDFPRVEATCDSSQYFSMYIIVLDLLLYAEPLEKIRNEKLEKIMLASDFSDLTGTAEMVERLQDRINTLYELKQNFQIHSRELDVEGWKSRLSVDRDLAICEDELFFMMKAITTAQRKKDDRGGSKSSGVVRWYLTASDIVWHLLRDKADPLMDIALKKAAYERVDNADGSNYNTVEVEMLRGFNLLQDAAYPEMIAPYWEHTRTTGEIPQTKMLRVYWNMLEAIAGIPIMDHFEVNLYPMKIQLERDIGDRIFEYIFPGVGKSALDSGGFSPFMVHSMKPVPDDTKSDHDSDSESIRLLQPIDDSSSTKSDLSNPDLHLRPTLSLSPDHRPKTASLERPLQRPKTASSASIFSRRTARKGSMDSFPPLQPRKSLDGGTAPSIFVSDKGKKKQLFSRTNTSTLGKKPSDELSQMMSRASNYMTLSYIKIPSVVLCLSYKGLGDSNIEDVHEFVFKMPMLEYRNKTWSNLDLAIHLKQDIIRALISHTGAILRNKLTHHRPNKQQPNVLRMMANNGSLATSSSSRDSIPDSAQGLQRANTLDPRTANFLRVDSSMSTASAWSPASSSATSSAASPTPSSDTLDQPTPSLFSNSRRALSNRFKDTPNGDEEESIKSKARLLLGKKVFGGL